MGTHYETDVIAWAGEQAALLRSGRLAEIDIEHIDETGLDQFPDDCPWAVALVLSPAFYPE